MAEIRLFETGWGYITEDADKKEITIFTNTIRDYDGIKDKDLNKTVIKYDTGLYMEWTNLGYRANYCDYYKDRDKALAYAKTRIHVPEDEKFCEKEGCNKK